MTFLYYLLQLTWGLPQNILGAILWLFCPSQGRYRCALVSRWGFRASMGLGCFVFLGTDDAAEPQQILVHEYGHTIQSLILGPMFLPVIGLPSLFWSNLPQMTTYRKTRHMSYYDFYPERWANRLGEKVTGLRGPER